MHDKQDALSESMRRMHDETRQFTQRLLEENERLRDKIALLSSECACRDTQLRSLQEELERHRRESDEMQRQLTSAEVEGRKFAEQFADLERQNYKLLNLYVASMRLHGTLVWDEVLATIQEIITNLIGSEELAVFVVDEERQGLRLVSSMGLEGRDLEFVPGRRGRIGRAAATGQGFVADETGQRSLAEEAEEHLTACIPLKVGERVIGVIAIFRLLAQKEGLSAVDRELFDLLGCHAALALYSAHLHARYSGAVACEV